MSQFIEDGDYAITNVGQKHIVFLPNANNNNTPLSAHHELEADGA
jgi:hypothetical protein